MSIWWSLQLRREAASVPFARRLLLRTMETAGVDPEISYDLSIALSEACANAVEHGGTAEWGTGVGEYHVTAHIEGDRCRIEVTDSGPGFSPTRTHRSFRPLAMTAAHQQESGRGLFLIESLVDHVAFRNRPGRGAVVSFDKILKWREDALLKVS